MLIFVESARGHLRSTSREEALAAVDLPGVGYARTMGDLDMRSMGEETAYAQLVAAYVFF